MFTSDQQDLDRDYLSAIFSIQPRESADKLQCSVNSGKCLDKIWKCFMYNTLFSINSLITCQCSKTVHFFGLPCMFLLIMKAF